MRASNPDLLEALLGIEALQDNAAVLEFYSDFGRRFGVTKFIVSHLPASRETHTPSDFFFSNWPVELIRERRRVSAIRHDPMVRHARRKRTPFFWNEALYDAPPKALALSHLAEDFGLKHGLVVPMQTFGQPPGAISIGGSIFDCSPEEFMALQMVSQQVYIKLQEDGSAKRHLHLVELSRSETDVLQYAADGKDAWSTSVMMKTSLDAVNDALKRARRKLNAVNKTHAVVLALKQGLIR